MILEDMIKDNVKNMPPSGIRKYFDIINEMEDVISLGVGEPDFVTPWNIAEAGIYSLEQGHTHYSSNAGYIELRLEIAKYLERRFNLSYNPDNEIIVTVGGSEGIDIALRALVGPGDEVIIPEIPKVVDKPAIVDMSNMDGFIWPYYDSPEREEHTSNALFTEMLSILLMVLELGT